MEGGPENGWLRTYLDDRFAGIDRRFDCLERKIDGTGDRVTRLEAGSTAERAGRAERRRWIEGLREWLSPLIGAVAGALSGWLASHR
jgi:hypothetical protein